MHGVDTIGLSFPIRDADLTSDGVTLHGRPGEGGVSWRRSLPSGGWLAGGVGGVAWVETNLPKRADGDNVDTIPDRELSAAVASCMAEALEYVEPGPSKRSADGFEYSAADPKLTRLDLVRDFQLKSPARLPTILDGLASVPRSGRVDVRRFAAGKTGCSQTLRVGPGSWAATLYDKHAETKGTAPAGRLRFEARLRSRQLASRFTADRVGTPIQTMSDALPERLEVLRAAWFERAGFHMTIGVDDVWDKVGRADLTDRERAFFVGWLSARAARHVLRLSPTTERRFRRLAEELELSPSAGGRSEPQRLDYELGCEVVGELAA